MDRKDDIIDKKYQNKINEINDNYIRNINRINEKKIYIPLIIVLAVVLTPLFIFIFYYGCTELGWFVNYDGMYKTELPIEAPAKGGTLYLPNDWHFVEENGWYKIVNDDNVVIAYEVYHGYRSYVYTDRKYIWINYEVNPILDSYNIDQKDFENISDGSNNCQVYKYKYSDYYMIYFFDTCSIKGSDLGYSRKYIFVNCKDEDLLKKIHVSYVWGGTVNNS